ncbi:MAG: hypothetical protein JST61_07785 [Acidobacteria bacterium]|nr:hypothetical protein [Acidobacteriota bacterium]
MQITRLALALTFAFAPAALLAQAPATTTTTTPAAATTTTTPHRTINQRKENQQDRIAAGIKDGQLSAGQASHLEHQEAAINHEERSMRAQDNGHLTKADRSLINKQQNQESGRIYRDRHHHKKQ